MTTKHGKPEVRLHDFFAHHAKVAREIVDSMYRCALIFEPDHVRNFGSGPIGQVQPAEDMRLIPDGIVIRTDDGKGVWVPVEVFVPWEEIERQGEFTTSTINLHAEAKMATPAGYVPKVWNETSDVNYYAWKHAVASAGTELGFREWARLWGKP